MSSPLTDPMGTSHRSAGEAPPTRAELDARFNVHARWFTHQDPQDETLWARLHDMPETSFTHLVRSIHAEVVSAASEIAEDAGLAPRRRSLPSHESDRIVALGDSITADRGSWLEILSCVSELCGMRSQWLNAGVSGDSSTHARARFDRAVTAHQPRWVLIALGTNDAKRSTRLPGRRLVPESETEANVEEIVGLVRAVAAEPVLLTPPPVDPELMKKWNFDDALRWEPEDIEASASAIRRVAARCAVPLVDVLRGFPEPDGRWHLPDGLHPNQRGQAQIARTVISAVPWGSGS